MTISFNLVLLIAILIGGILIAINLILRHKENILDKKLKNRAFWENWDKDSNKGVNL